MIYILRIALRRIWKQKIHNLINICGLTVGIASSLIIFLFVLNELNYDNFHDKGDRIFKIYQHSMFQGDECFDGWSPVPMAATLNSEYPEVQNTVRLYQSDDIYIIADDKHFNIGHALYVDTVFFEIFSFELKRGDKNKVLSEPHTVVLTESIARKIFNGIDPINKMIRFENDTNYFRVTGISEDPPVNSHFEYDMLISMDAFWNKNSDSWLSATMNTYVLLRDGIPSKNLEAKFPELIKKYINPQVTQIFGVSMEEDFAKNGNFLEFRLQPIRDIHLNTSINHGLKPSSNRKYVYIFSIIAFSIILLAGINFVNLSTARSAERAHEVILYKILGSSAKRIIGQYLAEYALISLFSLTLSLLLVFIALPFVNRLTGLSLSLFTLNLRELLTVLPGYVILLGIIAGIYPACLLSSFKINSALKDKLIKGHSRATLRNILVIAQYFIAIVILSGMQIFYQQLKYMQNKDLGFNKDNIMILHRAGELKNQLGPFIDEVKKYPGISDITNSTSIPGFKHPDNAFQVEGRSQSQSGSFVLRASWADCSFINTYKMKVVAGRNFLENLATDHYGAIINEAAVKKMQLENPVGKRLFMPSQNGQINYHPIIGVVRDFHFMSLHSTIQPFIMISKPVDSNWGGFLSIRLAEGNKTNTIQIIESIWKKYTNDRLMEYSFLDDDLKMHYNEEKRISIMSGIFTLLAIFIACLGLLGLVMFLTVKRTKEIGIRKIVGARVWDIISMMSADTVKLIIISSLFAWPVAFFFLKNWLNDFPFRIGINPAIFFLSTLIVLALSMLTIISRTWFAATRDPAEALRFE